MALQQYGSLADTLARKNRGRKHEAQVNTSPNLWAYLPNSNIGEPIAVTFNGTEVARLQPDDTLTINIRGWHTQTSCKIIKALARCSAYLSEGRVWLGTTNGLWPVGSLMQFNSFRNLVVPDEQLTADIAVRERLHAVSIADLPDRERFMLELGQYKPQLACTKNLIAFAQGKSVALTPREIVSVLDPHVFQRVVTTCRKEAV